MVGRGAFSELERGLRLISCFCFLFGFVIFVNVGCFRDGGVVTSYVS